MKKNLINKIKTDKKIIAKKLILKLKKKWRFWRGFKKYFLNKKKVTFYKKLEWNFNEKRYVWHHLTKLYFKKIKNFIVKDSKIMESKYVNLLKKFELRLPVVLFRARFYTKLINSNNGVKNNNILVNSIIVNKIQFLLNITDLFQKRRQNLLHNKKNKLYKHRTCRLKWRKYRWKKARYLFWKIRRTSHLNLYLNKQQNNYINFLEINYKIPAGILLKVPHSQEILFNKNTKLISNTVLKKIYYLY